MITSGWLGKKKNSNQNTIAKEIKKLRPNAWGVSCLTP
jgi:hypothetical protein